MTAAIEDAAFEHIAVRRIGPVVDVALARPEARNALTAVTIRELTELARGLRLPSDLAAVVLTGGPAFFSAGADVTDFENRIRAPTLMETREVVMAGPDLCRAWEEIEAVTIVAIEGYCVGGACALALACDFRILGAGAFLRLPEVALGVRASHAGYAAGPRWTGAGQALRDFRRPHRCAHLPGLGPG